MRLGIVPPWREIIWLSLRKKVAERLQSQIKVLLLPRQINQKESMNLFTYAYYFFFYFYFSQKVEREFVCVK